MFESLECRQLFSLTLAAALPTGEPVVQTSAEVVESDSVAAKSKPKPKPVETYLVVTVEQALVT